MRSLRVAITLSLIVIPLVFVSCKSQPAAVGGEGESIIIEPEPDDAGGLFEPASDGDIDEAQGEGGPSQQPSPSKGSDVRVEPVEIVSSLDSSVSVPKGEDLDLQISADGGSGSYDWAAEGLPSGFALEPENKNAYLKGKSSISGKHPVTITVKDVKDPTNAATASFSLDVGEMVAMHTKKLPKVIRGLNLCDVPLRIVLKDQKKANFVESEGHGLFTLGEGGITLDFELQAEDGALTDDIVSAVGPFKWIVESRVVHSCRYERERDDGSREIEYQKWTECTNPTDESEGWDWVGFTRNQTWLPDNYYQRTSEKLWTRSDDDRKLTITGRAMYDGMLPVNNRKYKLEGGGDDLDKLPREVISVSVIGACSEGDEDYIAAANFPFDIKYPVSKPGALKATLYTDSQNLEHPEGHRSPPEGTQMVYIRMFDANAKMIAGREGGYGYMGKGTDEPLAELEFDLIDSYRSRLVEFEDDHNVDISDIKHVVLSWALKSYCRYKSKLHAKCTNYSSSVDLAKIRFETPYWEVTFRENDEGGVKYFRKYNSGSFDIATNEWISDPDEIEATPVNPPLGWLDPPNSQNWLFHRKALPEYREIVMEPLPVSEIEQ